jgi:hypothetical protein
MQLKSLVASTLVAATLSAASLGFGLSTSQASEHSDISSMLQVELNSAASEAEIQTDLPLVAPGFLRPDLVIRDWRVIPDVTPADTHNNVAHGEPYRLCYVVRNIGNAAAGAFRVAGGGLGIAFNPAHIHAGLAAGASDVGCLPYPTTPAPGVYSLKVTADFTSLVAESNEGNNSRTERIFVHP